MSNAMTTESGLVARMCVAVDMRLSQSPSPEGMRIMYIGLRTEGVEDSGNCLTCQLIPSGVVTCIASIRTERSLLLFDDQRRHTEAELVLELKILMRALRSCVVVGEDGKRTPVA